MGRAENRRDSQEQQVGRPAGRVRDSQQVARQIALQQGPLPTLFLRTSLTLNYSKAKIEALLSQEGTSKHRSGWITLHDKLVLPEKQAMSIITQIHDSLHIGPHALLTFLSPLFSPLHL